jgi:16S rRNA (guanine527-N7)-methyltransferase
MGEDHAAAWESQLRQGVATLGFGRDGLPALSEDRIQALIRYVHLLQQWGAAYNLSAVRTPSDIVTLHLLDCLAVVGPLRLHLGGPEATKHLGLLDVGSGAGLPGLVLALAMPDLQVSSVDAVAKMVAFMRQAGALLGLKNFQALHARVEGLKGRWDVITSRAFSSLEDFVRLTRPLIAPGGVWMAMKGKPDPAEIEALGPSLDARVEALSVPGLDANRCLVWLRPKEPTPADETQ